MVRQCSGVSGSLEAFGDEGGAPWEKRLRRGPSGCYLRFVNRWRASRKRQSLGVQGRVWRAEFGDNLLCPDYCALYEVLSTTADRSSCVTVHLHPVLKHGPRSLTVREVWRC